MPNLIDFIAAANADQNLMRAIADVKARDPQTFAEEVTRLAAGRGYAFSADEFLAVWQSQREGANFADDELANEQLAPLAGGTAATINAHYNKLRAEGKAVPRAETTGEFFEKVSSFFNSLKFW